MIDFRADLHCHSTYSDGTFTPEQLIHAAIEKGLSGLSITDHDTIDAYAEAMLIAKDKQFPLISGIEFSTVFKEQSVHVLAYSFATNSTPIQDLCTQHIQRRLKRNLAILERLKEHQMTLDLDELSYDNSSHAHSVGRPHIAMALMKKGYVHSIVDAFQRFIGEGKPCYVPGESISLEETLATIKKANGISIIAHPHLISNVSLLRQLLDQPFDGLEGYYGRFHATKHERFLKIAARKNWLITGGSDFHGSIKPQISLGNSFVNEETFSILQQQFLTNQISS